RESGQVRRCLLYPAPRLTPATRRSSDLLLAVGRVSSGPVPEPVDRWRPFGCPRGERIDDESHSKRDDGYGHQLEPESAEHRRGEYVDERKHRRTRHHRPGEAECVAAADKRQQGDKAGDEVRGCVPLTASQEADVRAHELPHGPRVVVGDEGPGRVGWWLRMVHE